MKGMDELFVVAMIEFGILLTPLFFIALDLIAGIRKAKVRNERITSYGWRRTVEKVAKYYNALLALAVVDCMQMGSIWYLNTYYGHHVFIFPFVTLLGAMGVAAIEIKSIYEPANAKEQREYREMATLAAELVKHRNSPEDIAKAVVGYMNDDLMKKNEDNKEENR